MSVEPDTEAVSTTRRHSLIRRLVLAVSIVACGSLVPAAAAIAAGGGLPPGDYVFASTSANAQFGAGKGGPPGPGVFVFVNQGLNSFQPEGSKDSETVTNSTMVQLSISSATGSAGGCFLIPASDFTAAKNLQSASLHTTLTATEMCPGAGAPVTGKNAVPLAGGGGGGLSLPITLDLKWTGHGVTATARDRSTFQCLDYSTQSTNVSLTSGGTASGTVSALSGTMTTDLAAVSTTDTQLEISGTPKPACLGF